MRIVVEAHSILKNRSGVGWFAHGMVRGIQSHMKPNDSIQLLTHPQEAMDVGDLVAHPQTFESPIDWIPSRVYHALKFRNTMPPVDLLYGKGIYFFPNFLRWPLVKAPSVIAVHDISMFDCPEFTSPANLALMTRHLPNSVKKADMIVAVSEFSKKTLCDNFPIDPKKVVVTHLAAEPSLYYRRADDEIAVTKARYGIFGKYMLFVGTLEPRKNLDGLIAAYRMLPAKLRKEVSLVLVGGRGWNDDTIRQAIADARIAGDRVILPGYVATEDLPALYSGAEAFVWPSFYEGFGLPIVEAMRCGTAVLTSSNSSLPESAGKAALFVDAKDTAQISDGMQRLLTDSRLRESYIAAGLKQAERFSWEKSAASFLQGLKDNHLA